jgi:hypothetical protein
VRDAEAVLALPGFVEEFEPAMYINSCHIPISSLTPLPHHPSSPWYN